MGQCTKRLLCLTFFVGNAKLLSRLSRLCRWKQTIFSCDRASGIVSLTHICLKWCKKGFPSLCFQTSSMTSPCIILKQGLLFLVFQVHGWLCVWFTSTVWDCMTRKLVQICTSRLLVIKFLDVALCLWQYVFQNEIPGAYVYSESNIWYFTNINDSPTRWQKCGRNIFKQNSIKSLNLITYNSTREKHIFKKLLMNCYPRTQFYNGMQLLLTEVKHVSSVCWKVKVLTEGKTTALR